MNGEIGIIRARLRAALLFGVPGIALASPAIDAPPPADPTAALYSNHQTTTGVSSPEYPYLIADPLRARPKVVDQGALLPGDAEPFACPGGVDASRPIALGEAVDPCRLLIGEALGGGGPP